MEIFTTILQNIQFNLFEVFLTCTVLSVIVYKFAIRKTNKLRRVIYKLEVEILDLNAELLFGKNEAPVIKIEHSSKVKTSMAK
jgi:hypothetical protein